MVCGGLFGFMYYLSYLLGYDGFCGFAERDVRGN